MNAPKPTEDKCPAALSDKQPDMSSQSCLCTRVLVLEGFIDGFCVVLLLRQVSFVFRELMVGPEAKLKIEIICSLHFPLTDTNWKQTISKWRPPPSLPHSASPKAISLVLFFLSFFFFFNWGGGKAGLGSL